MLFHLICKINLQRAMQQFRLKLKSAAKGKELLKRKADSLRKQHVKVAKKLILRKRVLGTMYNESLIFLAKSNWATGEVR